MTHGFNGFSVSSTRVQVGGSVTITGKKGDTLRVLLPGGKKKLITLDRNGNYTLKEPLGKEGTFTIADFDEDDPHEVDITVFQTN